MNLSTDWVEFLQSSKVEAIHWSSVGNSNAPDFELMAYALEFDYVVLTQDLDYGTILSATRAIKPSVMQIRAGRVHPTSFGSQVVSALRELEAGLQVGALVTVEQKRIRLRILPIR